MAAIVGAFQHAALPCSALPYPALPRPVLYSCSPIKVGLGTSLNIACLLSPSPLPPHAHTQNLPPFLGGTAELRPIDDAWAVILAQRAQQAQQEGQPNGAGEGVRASMGERDAGSDDEFFEA
jgi:hypothetical protein